VNCTVNGNTAGSDGGGITLDATGATMANCTVSGNTATGNGGGMACVQTSTPTMLDCIVWGNSGQPIFVDDSPSPVVAYSCIQDSDPDDAHVYPGTGNIDDNPLLVPGPLHDSYLSRVPAGQAGNSPCTDAGSDTAPNLGLDALTTRTDGLFDTGTADMGFHSSPAVWGDVDGNRVVDGLDYSAVIAAWMTTPGHPLWNRNADLDRNNVVDGLDLSLVLSEWTVWGDVDGNRVVDGMDLAAVIAAWRTTPDDPLWNPDADINWSGVVDGLDLSIVISNWTSQ
jgi:parallel beta-helix repeat protein